MCSIGGDVLLERPVDALSGSELLEHLLELRERIDQLEARFTSAARSATERNVFLGHTGLTTAMWLHRECRMSLGEAKTRHWAGARLELLPETALAFAAGSIRLEHVKAIASVTKYLSVDDRLSTDEILATAARDVDPTALRRLGEQIRDATGAADDEAGRAERRFESRWLSTSKTFDGMVALSGMLAPEQGAALLAALGALAAARSSEDVRTTGQRQADALTEIVEHYLACGGAPDNGGEPPQVVVTVGLDALRAALREQVGWLDLTGARLSIAAVRRLACDAAIVPAVLGGAGECLDIGRATRVWPLAIRRAARLRDGGCTFPGCTAGPNQVRLHHIEHWADGGPTSLANAASLCRIHHWLVHDGGWQLRREAGGDFVFTSPRNRELRAPPHIRAG